MNIISLKFSQSRVTVIHKDKSYFIPNILFMKIKKNKQIVYNLYKLLNKETYNYISGAFSIILIYYSITNICPLKIVLKVMTTYNLKIEQEIIFYKYISTKKDYKKYICEYYDYIIDDYKNNKVHYLILEHLEMDLYDFIFLDKNYLTDFEQCIYILNKVALSLEFLHHYDIVYNDLKLENIIISLKKKWIIKLIDFNCITFLKSTENYNNIGSGTLEFMSPDLQKCIINNDFSNLTIKSDVWSFGLLACSLFTKGNTPFFNKNKKILIQNIQNNKFHQNKKNCITYLTQNSIFKTNKVINKMANILFDCLQNNPERRLSMKRIRLKYL